MLSPNLSPKPLLPEEQTLIELLGWSEEEYRWFEAHKSTFGSIRPGEPTAFLDFGVSLALLVIGVALNFAASLFAPTNKPGTPARLETRTVDGQTIVNAARFAPTAGFDSQQNVVELGSTVPVVFANRETIGGITYGGVRVNTNLMWSQLYSLGGSQLIKALFLIGVGPIGAIDARQFAIGDNLLSSYELGTAGNIVGRLSFYFRASGGRMRATDLIAGRAAAQDVANSENAGAADVFQIRGVNGEWRSDFCYASKPSTQTTFGLYAPIGNDLAFRPNTNVRSARVASLKSVGREGNAEVVCNDDAQLKAERLKQNVHFSTRSGIVLVNGAALSNGTIATLAQNDTFSYYLSSTADNDTEFKVVDSGPDGLATCEDIAQAVSGLQRAWDDALIIGELYKVGSVIAIAESRSPADTPFVSRVDNEPVGNGRSVQVNFRVVRGGQLRSASLPQIQEDADEEKEHRNATNGTHLFRLAVATFALPRPAQVIEIGLRSTLGIRISGLCNYPASKTYDEADNDSCDRYEGDKIKKGDVLQVSQFQSGTYTGPETRYSFFRISYKIAGSSGAYTALPQLFGVRSSTQQPSFNYIRLQMPSEQRWEYEIMPVSGWEVRQNVATGDLEVLDSKIQNIRTVFGGGCTIEFNGELISRVSNKFRIPATENEKNIGPIDKDEDSYADRWGKLAEVFVFQEIQASTDGAEHEISYINIISRNAEAPLYPDLAAVAASIRSGPELRSLEQLSVYVNQGFGSTHLIGDVLRHFLTDSTFGLGEIVAPAQIDDASFTAANTWTYNRRYFFDGGVSEPFNFRQQGAEWAEYFLLDLLVRNGKFYLQPIALFGEAHTISGLYTAGNVSDFELTISDPAERTPPRISVKWREEKQSSDLASRGLFPVVREVTVREAGTPEDAPLRSIDLTTGLNNFCTNERHAIDVAKMACRKARLITSSGRITTRPDRAGFDPGKIIKLGMETVKFDLPQNGAILDNGTVVSVPTEGGTEPLPDGTYDALVWTGSGPIQEVSLVVSGGTNMAYAGSVFSLANVTLSSQTYKMQKVGFTTEGDVEVEFTEFPLDPDGFSLLTAGWDVSGNWIIEGALSPTSNDVTIVPTFTSVVILGLTTVNEGGAETYTASVSGPAGTYFYAWTCAGATVASPTAATTSITFPTAGTYTVNISSTLSGGPTRTSSLVVVAGAVPPAPPTVGTITVSGPTSPIVGFTSTYTAVRSGTASDMTWLWSVEGDSPIVPTGPSADITFDTIGPETVRARGNSATAADITAFDTHAVTVLAQTIGTVTVTGPLPTSTGVGVTYNATRSGNSTDTVWSWACPGATVVGSGASSTITFPTPGARTITATATSAFSSDSPASGNLALTAFAPSLLLNFDGTNGSTTFTDSSANVFTVTPVGNAQLSTTGPKFGSACGLFDGTGDYLDLPANAAFSFPDQFCVDTWVHIGSKTAFRCVFEIGLFSAGIMLRVDTGGNNVYVNNTSLGDIESFITLNTWTHLAITRDGANLVRVFVDGVQRLSATVTGTVNSGAAASRVGSARNTAGQDLQGRLDEFRVVKGAAVWTANFTPPAAPY